MTESSTDNGKTIAIVAYLALLGWIIALVMNSSNKTELGSFHIRQMLGIMIVGFLLYMAGWVAALVLGTAVVLWLFYGLSFVFWLLGFLGAVQGEKKLVPVLGEQFQEWFKGLA